MWSRVAGRGLGPTTHERMNTVRERSVLFCTNGFAVEATREQSLPWGDYSVVVQARSPDFGFACDRVLDDGNSDVSLQAFPCSDAVHRVYLEAGRKIRFDAHGTPERVRVAIEGSIVEEGPLGDGPCVQKSYRVQQTGGGDSVWIHFERCQDTQGRRRAGERSSPSTWVRGLGSPCMMARARTSATRRFCSMPCPSMPPADCRQLRP